MKKIYFTLILLQISLGTLLAQNSDSLVAKRGIFSTHVYLQNKKLSNEELKEIFQTTWQPHIKYKWATILKPIGPIMSVGGIGLAYIAIKGKPATAIVNQKEVNYTIRSLPKLLFGLGLLAGGLSLVESSNELTANAVKIYNATLNTNQRTSYFQELKLGISPSEGISLKLWIK